MLVIGGGDGHFSREVAPSLRNLLAARIPAGPPELRITESDRFRHSRQHANAFAFADICTLEEVFAPHSFDFIVGETCLHQVGPQNMTRALQSMKTVLQPPGMIWHVTDAIPDPRVYAPAALERAAKNGVSQEGAILPAGDVPRSAQAMAVESVSVAAREGLFNALRAGSRSAAFKNVAVSEIQGSFFLADALNRPYPEPDSPVLKYRSILYRFGQSAVELDPMAIPEGFRKLTYIGRRFLAGTHPVFPIEHRIPEWREAFRKLNG
jgi:hypothetical protein